MLRKEKTDKNFKLLRNRHVKVNCQCAPDVESLSGGGESSLSLDMIDSDLAEERKQMDT